MLSKWKGDSHIRITVNWEKVNILGDFIIQTDHKIHN